MKMETKVKTKTKGIAFSLIILIALVPIVSLVLIELSQTSERTFLISSIRINEMENLYDSIVNDYKKFVQISMPRAISSVINRDIETGIGVDDAVFRLEELVTNGSIYSEPATLMEGSTFPDWAEKINNISNTKGFESNITIRKIDVMPFDSWTLLVLTNLTITIEDRDGKFAIIRNVTLENKVDINGFEDPVYPLNTLGRGINIIQRSPYIGNYTQLLVSGTGSGTWFYGQSAVIPSSDPSSIGAVTNKNQKVLVTNSVVGIESLANNFGAVVVESSAAGITVPYVSSAANAMLLTPNNEKILVDSPNGKVWYIENFKIHENSSFYAQSLNGGSFLDRLEGKLTVQSKYQSLTPNIIGLESFVDKDFFIGQGLPVQGSKTNTDFLYFDENQYTSFKVKGIGGNFKIDEQADLDGKKRTEIYNVNQILE